MAYSVEQRTQEIGIRLALGAQASQVKNMVVRQGMVLALVGIVHRPRRRPSAWRGSSRRSSSASASGTRSSSSAFPAVLTFVALLAVWLPARRASRIDPIIALRYE